MNDIELAVFAHRYLGKRAQMAETFTAIEEDPGMLIHLEREIDLTIDQLGDHLAKGASSVNPDDRSLYSNTLRLMAKLEGQEFNLPTLAGLKGSPPFSFFVKKAIRTLRELDDLMAKGEESEPPENSWQFHKDKSLTSARLTATLTLEVYCQYVAKLFPELELDGSKDILLPLKEVLALEHNKTWLFQLVRNEYTINQGFSEELVEVVPKVSYKITQILPQDWEELNKLEHLVFLLKRIIPDPIGHQRAIEDLARFVKKLERRYDPENEGIFDWNDFIDRNWSFGKT